MNKNSRKIIFAVLVSLLLHSVFLAVSRHITLPGMGGFDEETRRIFRIKAVDKTPETIKLLSETEKTAVFPERERKEPLMNEVIFDREESISIEREDSSFERKKEKSKKEKSPDVPGETKEKVSRDDLARLSEKSIQKKTAPETKALDSAVLTEGPSSIPGAPHVTFDEAGYEERVASPGGDAEAAFLSPERMEVSAGREDGFSETIVERVGKYEDMASYLEVKLITFQNPATGEKFFKADVAVKKGIRIEGMPKDIIFLVDSSKSVTEARFEQIKRGLSDVLRGLKEEDTFNIIAFKNEQEQFAAASVRATPEKIREGRDFVASLSAEGRTNIETALLKIIQTPEKRKPSYVVLISDGRPTAGMTNAREIIETVTRINRGSRPIFSFGAGLRVNKYLLDFISYQNRAWSEFAVAGDTAARDLVRLYRNIETPLLTDLRYRMSGLESEDVFPKELPDFYHARGFTVYGKYWEEDAFSMQVLGEVNGIVKEFIFERKLSEAEKGGKEIEKAWAFNKIYHRISMETMGRGDKSVLREEIDLLKREYGIDIPDLDEENTEEANWEEE